MIYTTRHFAVFSNFRKINFEDFYELEFFSKKIKKLKYPIITINFGCKKFKIEKYNNNGIIDFEVDIKNKRATYKIIKEIISHILRNYYNINISLSDVTIQKNNLFRQDYKYSIWN
jgi:hypothetical protein